MELKFQFDIFCQQAQISKAKFSLDSLYKRQVQMNMDPLIQQMLLEGLNFNYFLSHEKDYLSCPLCSRKISLDNYPSLLECGHIMCQQCMEFEFNCSICGLRKQVLTHYFSSLLLYINIQTHPAYSSKFFIQKMIQEGLDYSHFQAHEEQYLNCPLCLQSITKTNFPILLECGHIKCRQCLKHFECGVEGKKKVVQEMPFSNLLKYIDIKNDPFGSFNLQTYTFLVRHVNQNSGHSLQNIPKSVTFEKLLQQATEFAGYLNRFGKRIQVTFGGSCQSYFKIKDKTIGEFIQQYSPKISPSSTGIVNLITFQVGKL